MLKSPLSRRLTGAAVVTMVLAGTAIAAFAGTASSPSTTIVVPGNGAGVAQAFDVLATGMPPSTLIYVEQCDGVSPAAPGWDPAANCDLGSSPAPALSDASGTAIFPVSNVNTKFTPFEGESPQSLFNCLSANAPASGNGLTDYRNCQVRVSSNNLAVTGDQSFFTMVLPDSPAPAPGTAGSCTAGKLIGGVKTATAGAGMTDQSQDVAVSGSSAKDLGNASAVIGGTCTGLLDSKYAGSGSTATSPVTLATLNPTKVSLKLAGKDSCAWNAASVAADATAAGGYQLQGALQITFAELSPSGKAYKLQAAVTATHSGTKSDLYEISGVVSKGLSQGAKISGTLYFAPAAKFGGTAAKPSSHAGGVPPQPFPAGYIGYAPNTVAGNANGCNDGVANNTSSPAVIDPTHNIKAQTGITYFLIGSGASPAGNVASGLKFDL